MTIRWAIAAESKGKKVSFPDSEADFVKQLAAIETEVQTLTKIRHTNIGEYINSSFINFLGVKFSAILYT